MDTERMKELETRNRQIQARTMGDQNKFILELEARRHENIMEELRFMAEHGITAFDRRQKKAYKKEEQRE